MSLTLRDLLIEALFPQVPLDISVWLKDARTGQCFRLDQCVYEAGSRSAEPGEPSTPDSFVLHFRSRSALEQQATPVAPSPVPAPSVSVNDLELLAKRSFLARESNRSTSERVISIVDLKALIARAN